MRFSFVSIAHINELRIIVIPSSESKNFSLIQAFLLSEESYHSGPIESINRVYSIRLRPSLLDVNGNPIEQDKDYVIKILMIGYQFTQLSMPESNKLTLTEQGIYNGYYEGVLCYFFRRFNPPSRNSGRLREVCATFGTQIFAGSGDNYIGQLGSMGITFSPEKRIIRVTGGIGESFNCESPTFLAANIDDDLSIKIKLENCSIPLIDEIQDGYDFIVEEENFILRRKIRED